MRTILTVLAAAVLGCGDQPPGDEVCASGELEINALYSTCTTANSGPAGCWFGCVDSGLGDGLKVCGCCIAIDDGDGDQPVARWEPCQ